MFNWLERMTPYASVSADNPVFKYEVRRIRWAHSEKQLASYSLKVLIIVHIVVAVGWALFIYTAPNRQTASSYIIRETSGFFIGLLLVVSVGANIILDVTSVAATVTNVSNEINSGRWDLLLLSNISAQQLVASKHALAQLRSWRIVSVLVSMRLTVITLIFLHIAMLSYSLSDPVIIRWIITAGCVFLPILILVGLLFIPYFVEPLWRVRALTGIAIAVSTRIHQASLALLAGLVVILVLWSAEIVIVVKILGWIFVGGINVIQDPLFLIVAPVLFIAANAIFHSVLNGLRTWALRHAVKHAFASD